MKRTEPTRSLLQGGPYTKAGQTDLRARFEAMRRASQPAPAQRTQPRYVIATCTGDKE